MFRHLYFTVLYFLCGFQPLVRVVIPNSFLAQLSYGADMIVSVVLLLALLVAAAGLAQFTLKRKRPLWFYRVAYAVGLFWVGYQLVKRVGVPILGALPDLLQLILGPVVLLSALIGILALADLLARRT